MVQHGHAQTAMMENVKMTLILGEWQMIPAFALSPEAPLQDLRLMCTAFLFTSGRAPPVYTARNQTWRKQLMAIAQRAGTLLALQMGIAMETIGCG